MAAAELIASGSTAASSSDVEVADGAFLIIALKDYDHTGKAYIELKDDDSAYNVVGSVDGHAPSSIVAGPGVFRVSRPAGASCGVFSG